MDNATRSALTALGLAGLVAFAVASSTPRASGTSDAAASSVASAMTTPSPSSTVLVMSTAPVDEPDPKTDYTKLDDAKADGLKAIGKTILLRVWRSTTDEKETTLFSCRLASSGYIHTTYAPEKLPLVKAIATTLPVHEHDRCPRVVITVTGHDGLTGDLKGDLQRVLDVTPADPPTLPAGVDYVSMDDINIDGKKAAGKIALLTAYRGDTEEKKFTAYPCTHSGGLNFINVAFTPEQSQLVQDFSSSPGACQALKIKLTEQHSSTWTATLVATPKD